MRKLLCLFLFIFVVFAGCAQDVPNNENAVRAYDHVGNQEGLTDWRLEADDVVIVFSPEDLWDEETKEFTAPKLALGCEKEEVLEHYGIEVLEAFPPTDPEMWFCMLADNIDCIFIPEFTFGETSRYCNMYIKPRISDNLDNQAKALIPTFEEAFGDSKEELVPGAMLGLSDEYAIIKHEWKTEDEHSIFQLLITTCNDSVSEIQILIYKKT